MQICVCICSGVFVQAPQGLEGVHVRVCVCCNFALTRTRTVTHTHADSSGFVQLLTLREACWGQREPPVHLSSH